MLGNLLHIGDLCRVLGRGIVFFDIQKNMLSMPLISRKVGYFDALFQHMEIRDQKTRKRALFRLIKGIEQEKYCICPFEKNSNQEMRLDLTKLSLQ